MRPTKYEISSASTELDVLPPSDAQRAADGDRALGTQIHQMVLTYAFEVQPGDNEETQSVIPRVASLHQQLYDSPLDSLLWRLEAADTGAILDYGGAIHDARSSKLRKGKYKVSLLLRHPEPSQLDALKDLPLLLKMDLAKAAECKVFDARGAASVAGSGGMKPMTDVWLRRGGHKNLYVAAPTETLPSWVSQGDSLVGSLIVDRGASDVTRIALTYAAPPPPAKKDGDQEGSAKETSNNATEADNDDKEAKAIKEDEEALDKALLEAKLTRLAALRSSGASSQRYEALSEVLYEKHRTHLPLLLELLAWQRRPANKTEGGAEEAEAVRAAGISKAADALLAPEGPIDKAALAQFWGVALDDSADASKAAKEAKKEMEAQRKALRLALFAKAAALSPPELVVTELPPTADAKNSTFVAAVKEMKQWVTKPEDLEEAERDDLAFTLSKYELAHGRPAGALALLQARLKAQPSKKMATACIDLYKALGWIHWVRNFGERLHRDYPQVRTPL